MSFLRIRAWQARRNERRNEELIALSQNPKKYIPDIQGQLDKANAAPGIGEAMRERHAGEEGKNHY